MHCVYVLFSKTYNRLYVGETADLISRFQSHNALATNGFTIKYRPWLVVYVEFFDSRPQALSREKALKSGQGRAWIRSEILPKYT
jgi:putative endonuclease